jgi:nucleoid-associated protein YgaU
MNGANPFQIPTCFQIEAERKNREKFKRNVLAAVAAAVLLLVGLLIEGCKSERAAAVTPSAPVAVAPVAHAPVQTALVPMPGSNHGVMPQPVPTAQKASMTPALGQTPTFYIVKSGDTLTKIAKAHGISVKALKSANDLSSDQIVVGAKLKIPTA